MTIGDVLIDSFCPFDHLKSELIPRNQTRDWKLRWKLIQDEIQLILRPHREALSTESIYTSQQRLFSFFILTYHLKDALKDAAPGLGLKPSDVEDVVTTDARLALLADLANLDKHMELTRQPRSGVVPAIEKVSGVDQGGSDWQLSVQIKHGTSIFDGLVVAEEAVSAWREKLIAWGLI